MESDVGGTSAAMLQEAQTKVSTLMAEVYGLRREKWEAQQALNQALSQRNSLTQRIAELEQHVAQLQPLAERAQQLEAKLSTAETHIDTLTQQVAALQHENKTLLEQSATDQASRKRADDTRTWADAERFRLQRSRDELALKVKELEQRLVDMEEEQASSDHALTVLKQELAAVQTGSTVGESAAQLEHKLLEEERARAASLLQALEMEKQRSRMLQQQVEAQSSHSSHPPPTAPTPEQWRALQQHCQELEEALHVAHAEADAAAAAQTPPQQPQPSSTNPDPSDNLAAQQLATQVTKLKASRDRLLAQLDAQAAELDRLGAENVALQAGASAAEDASARLLTQLQGSLEQNERLKDLLDESAQWAGATVLARENLAAAMAGVAAGSNGDANGGAGQHNEGVARQAEMANALALERARVADLDLQIRALCAELTRAMQANAAVNNNVLPLLSNIEERLDGVARLSVEDVLVG